MCIRDSCQYSSEQLFRSGDKRPAGFLLRNLPGRKKTCPGSTGEYEPEAPSGKTARDKGKHQLLSAEKKQGNADHCRMWFSDKPGGGCSSSERRIPAKGCPGSCGRYRVVPQQQEIKKKIAVSFKFTRGDGDFCIFRIRILWYTVNDQINRKIKTEEYVLSLIHI